MRTRLDTGRFRKTIPTQDDMTFMCGSTMNRFPSRIAARSGFSVGHISVIMVRDRPLIVVVNVSSTPLRHRDF
jgi:hypothetical protein